MSHGFFLNMEPILNTAINDNISKLRDDLVISEPDDFEQLNLDALVYNFQYGSIACILMATLYETVINTIITSKLKYNDEDVLKASSNVKIQIICHDYGFEFATLKSDNSYGVVKEIIKLRNDIVHYKTNMLYEGVIPWADMTKPEFTSKKPLAYSFAKSTMQKYFTELNKFINLLCDKCDLKVNEYCQIIECDGRNGIVDYIINKTDDYLED